MDTFKDRYGKDAKSVMYAIATRDAKKEKRYKEEVQLDEKIKGLINKSEKSGISYSILKKVYDRGMAAWKTGHRPGTTPQQWAFARVNAFLYLLKNGRPQNAKYTTDYDLLPSKHPKSRK